MRDPFEKFTQDICCFLDTIRDMPENVQLIFSIEVKKVGNGQYHLKNSALREIQ